MLPRRSLCCFLIWLVFPGGGAARAEELVFGIYDLPVRAFTPEEIRTFPENGQADAAAVLKQRGFDLPEGSSAFYDADAARIFLRSTRRDVNHVRRIAADLPWLELPGDAERGPVPQVLLTAVCYAVPLTALPPDFGPQSDIAALPADKLSVVDRASLICRSGQRAKTETETETEQAPDTKPADAGDAPPPEAGRLFEMECTISDNGRDIDINMAWEIRTPKLAAAGEAGKFKIATQIMIRPGGLVLQELGITEEPEPRLVFLTLRPTLVSPAPAEPAVKPPVTEKENSRPAEVPAQ